MFSFFLRLEFTGKMMLLIISVTFMSYPPIRLCETQWR